MSEPKIDVSQVFLVFMALVGDVSKTALALDIPEATVQEMADREGWADKVKRISVQSKSGKPGDWERAQNRALNFVQAHQLRRAIDRVITRINEQDAQSLIEHTSPQGNVTYTARIFTELTKAMQSCHEMTYSALGDSVKERDTSTADGETTALNSAALHAAVIGGLNRAKLAEQNSETLVREAVSKVEELKSANPCAAEVAKVRQQGTTKSSSLSENS